MLALTIFTIIATSIIIYFTGKHFAQSSSNLGEYFNLPKSVKGATFDAIASSFPELMVAVFSVLAFKQFEVGIGTIAGSALFNLLIIPGICVLVAPVAFKVSKEIYYRDALFYLIAIFALLSALIYKTIWTLGIPIIFLIIYAWYIQDIVKDTKKFQKNHKKTKNVSLSRNLVVAILTMIIMGFATYFLTESSIELAHILNIHPIIIAFTVVAAATSVPDTVVSVVNARKGNIDDAASNVFGSNVFDILVGLSIPLILAFFISGPVEIVFEHIEIILGLFGSTIIALYFLKDRIISKKEGILFLLMYLAFLTYVIFLSV